MIRRALTAALAALALLAPAAPAASQDNFPPQPALGTPKPFAVPAAESYRLANGMQVTLIPYGKVPKATVSLRIYAGSLNEGENSWLSTFTGQMLREGAAGRSAADIAEAAAGMGGNLGIGTDEHETAIGLSVLAANAGDAVRLVGDVALRPDFPASEFDRVRQNLIRVLAVAKSQPQPAADAALAAAYYGTNHPYGRPYASEAQLAGYSLDAVRSFYQQNFGARRARLYVAGQFDSEAIKAVIEQVYGGWAAGPERLSLPPQPQPGPKVLLVNRPGATQSTVRLAFPAPAAGAESDIPFRVTNALLGGSFTSRITTNIREDKGYTYSPTSGIGHNPGQGLWTFEADVTTAVTGAALKEVFGEIRRLQNEAPPQDEASGIQSWLAGTFILQNASPGGLIGSLATRDFHGLPANWLETYVPTVLAVGAPDIQQLTRETLPLDKMTLVVVGDLAKVERQLKALPELKNVRFRRVTPF
jgi:predicted Zn-dependent peptidase